MAFTTKNILDILQGNGNHAPTDNTLFDVLTIVALRHANYMYNEEKVVVNEASVIYKQKMFNVANAIIDRNEHVIQGVLCQTIIDLGNVADINHFNEIDSNLWANHLGDHILQGFEKQAKVTNAERISYNAE